jgi:YVTN family beta-propeller protein
MLRSLLSIRVLMLALAVLFLAAPTPADDQDMLKVGVQPDGRILVPTNQILSPAGKHLTFPGRPVDLALSEGGKVLVIKNMRDLVFVDLDTQAIKQTLPLAFKKGEARAGFGLTGLVVSKDKVYAGDAQQLIRIADRQGDGTFQWDEQKLTLNKASAKAPEGEARPAYPAGMARVGEDLWVASSRGNTVQRFDLAAGKVVAEVAVGVAPFAVVSPSPDKLYVSNWGGDAPKDGDPKGVTSGTPVRVDARTNVANQGTVSVLARSDSQWKQIKTIEVGLRPGGMTLSRTGKRLYVANASSDSVSVIDTAADKVVETILCRAEARLPFGSGCNAVALSPDGATLYVANGTNNCLAVVRLGSAANEAGMGQDRSQLLGLIPTGWFPGAIVVSGDGKTLYVANVKGIGALSEPRKKELGRNSHDHMGSLSIIPVPDEKQLAAYTAQVNANNRVALSLAGLDKPRPDVKPVPVPQRFGEPSVFKHVLYIIKENRTYDQLLGDMKEGNGDPKLVLFGEDVTPNHHKLAREFTLFDNFYCSGVLSADGHTWVNQAYVGDYLEKAFGGFTRSYPDDGSDHLAYAPTGFLWDNALLHKKTIRNFGEYVANTFEPKTARWKDFYDDYKNGTNKVKASAKANVKALEPYTHPDYPWFPLYMPDVYRTRLFLEDLKGWEAKGEMPNLIYVTLPCDHTDGTRQGTPTPRAMVADNDLALGQLVEGVSKSKFWADTVIFVVEDDPQNGFDHVDGHRTMAMVLSPYTKRKWVDSTCYNQTGMVKTIELILGLSPMNQLDLSATPMRNCFTDTADLTPYTAVPNKIPLDEMNRPLEEQRGMALHWARKSHELNLDEGDAADEDTLNRILWFSVHGEKPYPEAYVARKDDAADDDDDDD